MKHKTKVVHGLTGGIEMLFKKNKVDYLKGFGRFQDSNTLIVDTGKESQTYTANHFIIATGSEPNNLPGGILPIDENRVISSTGALSLKEVPKKLIVVGGGVIGLELGSVYGRLGSEVHVIEYTDRLVPMMDHEISDQFLKILKKSGMKFHFNHKVVGGKVQKNNVIINTEDVKVNF